MTDIIEVEAVGDHSSNFHLLEIQDRNMLLLIIGNLIYLNITKGMTEMVDITEDQDQEKPHPNLDISQTSRSNRSNTTKIIEILIVAIKEVVEVEVVIRAIEVEEIIIATLNPFCHLMHLMPQLNKKIYDFDMTLITFLVDETISI